MDLLCCESTSKSVAQKDPVLLLDDRVFDTMLKSETRCMPMPNYIAAIQKDLTPNLRKIVVDWMWEVSIVVSKKRSLSARRYFSVFAGDHFASAVVIPLALSQDFSPSRPFLCVL